MSTPMTPFSPFTPAPEDAARQRVRLAVAGDPAAIAELLRSIQRPVRAVIRKILGRSPADADDATQQTLIAFIHALPSYRGDGPPVAFATTIAVRTAIAVRRRLQASAVRVEWECDAEALESARPVPSDEAMAARRRALLGQVLGEIPEEQAEALAMRIVLGWSLDEVASRAGVPLNTVRSRIRLAKEALRRRIEASPEAREALDPRA